MQQVLIRIPGLNLPIFGFGAMLFVAFLSCTWLAGWRARREGIAPEHVQDLAIWLFVSGLIGARITYLIVPELEVWKGFGVFLEHLPNILWQLPRIWDGGIILYGSVIGGLLGYLAFYFISFRRYHIPTLQLADIIAPSVALGIAFGRIGCFLNGCCYGQVACADCAAVGIPFPLSAPPRYALVQEGYQTAAGFTYALEQPTGFVKVGRVEKGSRAEQAGLRDGDLIEEADGEPLTGGTEAPGERLSYLLDSPHERGRNVLILTVRDSPHAEPRQIAIRPWTLRLLPTQLYETISMLLLFLVLMALYPLRQRQGLVTAVLMIGYALHRALNELLRADPRPEGLESYFSYLLFAAGLLLAVYVFARGRKVETRAAEPDQVAKVIPAGANAPA
jgi:phosphatidylglycerol:prolipoprotein diacylglycerol transferase